MTLTQNDTLCMQLSPVPEILLFILPLTVPSQHLHAHTHARNSCQRWENGMKEGVKDDLCFPTQEPGVGGTAVCVMDLQRSGYERVLLCLRGERIHADTIRRL